MMYTTVSCTDIMFVCALFRNAFQGGWPIRLLFFRWVLWIWCTRPKKRPAGRSMIVDKRTRMKQTESQRWYLLSYVRACTYSLGLSLIEFVYFTVWIGLEINKLNRLTFHRGLCNILRNILRSKAEKGRKQYPKCSKSIDQIHPKWCRGPLGGGKGGSRRRPAGREPKNFMFLTRTGSPLEPFWCH